MSNEDTSSASETCPDKCSRCGKSSNSLAIAEVTVGQYIGSTPVGNVGGSQLDAGHYKNCEKTSYAFCKDCLSEAKSEIWVKALMWGFGIGAGVGLLAAVITAQPALFFVGVIIVPGYFILDTLTRTTSTLTMFLIMCRQQAAKNLGLSFNVVSVASTTFISKGWMVD